MIMGMLSRSVNACLCCILALSILTHVLAQSQVGFISIDCGRRENSSYTEETTGLIYVPDSTFLSSDTGLSRVISFEYYDGSFGQPFYAVRSFPDGKRNCYKLMPDQGRNSKYLIRARFLHGSYDGKDTVPKFDLYLGANKWGPVKLDNVSSITTMEIVHVPTSDFIFLCLVNTGHGTPFISVLELRPMKDPTYSTETQAAALYKRLDLGSGLKKTIRYKDDEHDRIWEPINFPDCKVLSTLNTDVIPKNIYNPPLTVMATAVAPKNASAPLTFSIQNDDFNAKYYFYMHFAEVEKLEINDSRVFDIYTNGNLYYGPFSPTLDISTVYSIVPLMGGNFTFELVQNETSNHPPIFNALEIFIGLDFSESPTDEQEVNTILNIKSYYGVKKNWQGDPCAPKAFKWDGLNCSFGDADPHRIISLDLSSSGLTGEISSHISKLKMIEFLNLSNNHLTGYVPVFLSKLKSLKVLDLRGNNLNGSVPQELIKRSQSGSLSLSVDGNPDLLICSTCQRKSNKHIVLIVAIVVTPFVLLIALLVGWVLIKRRKRVMKEHRRRGMRKIGSALEPKNHQFTYSEIMSITNNFERVIGKGGFGTVYHGYLSDTQVAVKMLSESSAQGYKEFQAEVKLLLRVHHINLTSLIGYCYEDNYMALIYEYMINGNLGRLLSDKSEHTLSWEDRLRIAVDSAQGLEYLHHGCKPPVVHRDVKPTNILLNEKYEAKLADFGLSRAFPVEGGAYVSTAVAGTPGYLDPECFKEDWLNEKSDVYSFGVVLLEIITGRLVLTRIDENQSSHISQWVESMVEKGEIKNIVDPRLQGNFEANSAWKAVEIEISCVGHNSIERPRMNQIVMELNGCLALETASKKNCHDQGKDSITRTSLNFDTDPNPLPR